MGEIQATISVQFAGNKRCLFADKSRNVGLTAHRSDGLSQAAMDFCQTGDWVARQTAYDPGPIIPTEY